MHVIIIVIESLNQKLWPFKGNFANFNRFTHDLSLIITNHVITVANFEQFLISPDFLLDFRKKPQNVKKLAQKL